mmetsp:Transcript_15845/g.24683  ORF Transcript_15845/g.24683 Transcript_15845/m.24683 type:complete len:338 (-) Transcript_15845:365-1378(-)
MKFYSQCIATLYLATSALAFVVQKTPGAATSFIKPKTDDVGSSKSTELNVYAYGTQTRSRTLETRPYGERAFRMDRDRGYSTSPMRMMRYDDYYYRGSGTDGYGYGYGGVRSRYGYGDYERDSELGYGRRGGYGGRDYYNNYRSSRTYRSPFTSYNGSLGGNGNSYYNNGRYYNGSGGYGYGVRDRDYYGGYGGYGGGYGRDYYGSGGYGRDYYGGYGRGVLRSDAFNRYGGNYHNDGYSRYGGSVYADTRPFDSYDYDRSSRYVNADYRSRNYYNRDNYGYGGGYGYGRGYGGYGGDYYGGYNSGYGMGNRGGRWASDAYGRRSSSTYRNSFNVYG